MWLVLGLALAAPGMAAADCPHAGDVATTLSPGDRRAALLCAIDDVRASNGLAPVTESADLTAAAQHHAADMVARGFFAHVTPDGATVIERVRATKYLDGASTWALGEAIAWAQDPLDTADALMTAWMNSPPHRAIILDGEYREVGIGLAGGVAGPPGGPGATAVLDFGTRTTSRTLPRWRSATSCARAARRSPRTRTRCASTSTRSARSRPAHHPSSTRSATTWKARLLTSRTIS